jgi:Na+-driven multidrug efflux pump
MGARGFWIAIIVSLTAAAVFLLARLRRREHRFHDASPPS